MIFQTRAERYPEEPNAAFVSIVASNSLTLQGESPAMEEEFISSPEEVNRLLYERRERLKELACINATNEIIKQHKPVPETLQQICYILPAAWQFPEFAVARIQYDGNSYETGDFRETEWKQSQTFETIQGKKGEIAVYYTRKLRDYDEGPFLREERQLIDNLATIIVNWLNTTEAKVVLQQAREAGKVPPEVIAFQEPATTSRQLLQKFLDKQNTNRDILFDLMPFKVKEILLVATLYDAFSIEKEGRFSEHILGEYHQLNLTSMPRVTGVSSYEDASRVLREKHFDLVIIMVGNDKKTPVEISRKVKREFPFIPVFVLLNNDREVSVFKNMHRDLSSIDRIFVWNGDSKVFFAMVKLLEDRVNVENDTQVGMVKVILLVEDSEIYYSRYLPLLYQSVLEQTRRIIDDVSTDEMFKVLRLRARPKILLASTYEEAISIITKYKENLLCLITDVIFERNGKADSRAGFMLASYVREYLGDLPVVIQSADTQNIHQAHALKVHFINKNSESLLQDIRNFISHYLGFGNFIYRDSTGKKIAEAASLQEFEKLIDTIPAESLVYHGKRNHFSLWLMARGEIKIAKMIHPVKVTDFGSSNEFRNYLKYVIKKYRNESQTGKVIPFEKDIIIDESNIISLGTGALGGKGRGLAFINTIIYNLNFNEILPGMNISTPRTFIIGTDEFDLFLEKNNLHQIIYSDIPYRQLQEIFLKSDLSYELEKKLKALLRIIQNPIAVRSSSLFEDATSQPFSGIFATYLLPDNYPDFDVRFHQLEQAIKLVYASVYSDHARAYFKAVDYKIEEEKMAVVIQEVVGNRYGQYFYPHISGTAQSHNYYPVASMEAEDGFAVTALGLGHYVVGGEVAYRFVPRYPDVEIMPVKDLVQHSQREFIALDLSRMEFNLIEEGEQACLARLPISEAEKHGTLLHLASVYDPVNDRIDPGLTSAGPRIINFADILKYNYIPLARAIDLMLDIMREAVGGPVEIEFAVDASSKNGKRPVFYLLQLKPMYGSGEDFSFNPDEFPENAVLLRSGKSMGNGKIDDLTEIVYVDPDAFDKTRTPEIAKEIELINARLIAERRKYILIGPGRWGSRDRFVGIPVVWPQISNARVIVETSLEDFPLDASLGSHFFHNITSMNIGYLSVQHASGFDIIQWEALKKLPETYRGHFVRHVSLPSPVTVLMDGKKRISVIVLNGLNHL